mmetsp:Transcript_16021/g.38259  ORF Transcript_16021/g.38259 Transcript_16021/m.38259 type:complete len:938 (-) Transcript_16021:2221-5034(-)
MPLGPREALARAPAGHPARGRHAGRAAVRRLLRDGRPAHRGQHGRQPVPRPAHRVRPPRGRRRAAALRLAQPPRPAGARARLPRLLPPRGRLWHGACAARDAGRPRPPAQLAPAGVGHGHGWRGRRRGRDAERHHVHDAAAHPGHHLPRLRRAVQAAPAAQDLLPAARRPDVRGERCPQLGPLGQPPARPALPDPLALQRAAAPHHGGLGGQEQGRGGDGGRQRCASEPGRCSQASSEARGVGLPRRWGRVRGAGASGAGFGARARVRGEPRAPHRVRRDPAARAHAGVQLCRQPLGAADVALVPCQAAALLVSLARVPAPVQRALLGLHRGAPLVAGAGRGQLRAADGGDAARQAAADLRGQVPVRGRLPCRRRHPRARRLQRGAGQVRCGSDRLGLHFGLGLGLRAGRCSRRLLEAPLLQLAPVDRQRQRATGRRRRRRSSGGELPSDGGAQKPAPHLERQPLVWLEVAGAGASGAGFGGASPGGAGPSATRGALDGDGTHRPGGRPGAARLFLSRALRQGELGAVEDNRDGRRVPHASQAAQAERDAQRRLAQLDPQPQGAALGLAVRVRRRQGAGGADRAHRRRRRHDHHLRGGQLRADRCAAALPDDAEPARGGGGRQSSRLPAAGLLPRLLRAVAAAAGHEQALERATADRAAASERQGDAAAGGQAAAGAEHGGALPARHQRERERRRQQQWDQGAHPALQASLAARPGCRRRAEGVREQRGAHRAAGHGRRDRGLPVAQGSTRRLAQADPAGRPGGPGGSGGGLWFRWWCAGCRPVQRGSGCERHGQAACQQRGEGRSAVLLGQVDPGGGRLFRRPRSRRHGGRCGGRGCPRRRRGRGGRRRRRGLHALLARARCLAWRRRVRARPAAAVAIASGLACAQQGSSSLPAALGRRLLCGSGSPCGGHEACQPLLGSRRCACGCAERRRASA